MEYNYCYIFDYSNCEIYCLLLNKSKYNAEAFETAEELLRHWGFNPDECSWMFSDVELKIDYICKPFKD